MSQQPIPPLMPGKWGWLAAGVATFILLFSIVLVAFLWVQDSEDPPPGSLLPTPVEVTTTPQYATTPNAYAYVRRT